MMYLEFEKPIVELETKIAELRALSDHKSMNLKEELARLEKKVETVTNDIFSKLTVWERTQLSRHPQRPYTIDYIENAFDEFEELHGDRNYADDSSMICGIIKIDQIPMMLIGQQKGRSTKEKVQRNFGMCRPEGYRKALRVMRIADRYHLPIVTLIDTPGAYPGVGAEERGQAEAIAKNIMVMNELRTPIVSVVIGEGGSGGALAIGVADHLMMLEYSIYSVISPESCAAILWRSSDKAQDAAKSLKLVAPEVRNLQIADQIIEEPKGGAHRDPKETFARVRREIKKNVLELQKKPLQELLNARYKKYRSMGTFTL
ncbi:MAG: acetyl-CoA carboxylase carboxyltransferase subunit alpha [Bdellovibrionales bacterium]|nr:acetyl-CoA carboxylase carboxyltransferase subunit alpha [Bdellovibrionales bacterium]